MPSELWTIEKVAARWKLKPSWIYQHIRELPHIKLGNLVRFDPEELEKFLLKSKRGPSGNSLIHLLIESLTATRLVSRLEFNLQVAFGLEFNL